MTCLLPTLIIFFRETLEASLIVGILLAYLRRVGRSDQVRVVAWGIAFALAADLGAALASYRLVHAYDGSRLQTVVEGLTYVVAALVLAGMSLFMHRHSPHLRSELEQRAEGALSQGSAWALFTLAAVTVGREGLETAFFTLALALSNPGLALAAGALVGTFLGLGTTYLLYRLGQRVPLSTFFRVLGVVLALFAAGLLANGVGDLQSLGWLPFLTGIVWHTRGLLREDTLLGDLLHSFFGYTDAPTALQVAAYAGFLAFTLLPYARPGRAATGTSSGR